MKRLLLIDADILAYKVAAMNEEEVDFGDGGKALHLAPEKVNSDIKSILHGYMRDLNGDSFQICLSDPKLNWRKSLDETYKSNRKATKKPILLDQTKAYLYDMYSSSVIEWLEADDVMGIMATNPKNKNEVVIVSEDKDMRTIPGLVYHPHHSDQGIMDITKTDANRFLLWQTLTGDQTDGYPGCPGIGKSNDYVLDLMTLTKPASMWDCVIDAYASKGLTEKHAIHQARLACICRYDNWNAEKRRVRLWNPTHLHY